MDWILEHWMALLLVGLIISGVELFDIVFLRGLRSIKGKGEEPTVEDAVFIEYYFNFPWRKKQKNSRILPRVMSPDERAAKAFIAGLILGVSFVIMIDVCIYAFLSSIFDTYPY